MATRGARAARKDPYMDGSGGWNIPQLSHGLTFADIGSTGLRQYSGYVREEFARQLLGREAVRVYRESPGSPARTYAEIRGDDWQSTPDNIKRHFKPMPFDPLRDPLRPGL
jgi:hypothetical protein